MPTRSDRRDASAMAGGIEVGAPLPGSVEATLTQAVGWLLPGSAPVEPLADPADEALLVGLAATNRVLGPLLAAVDGGALELSAVATDLAAASHEAALAWCLQVEIRLLEITSWFHEAGGVPHLVVKGPAAAHLDALDPSLRSFADLDLFVPGSAMDQTVALLVHRGAVREVAERRPGFDRRFVKSVTVVFPDGVEIDVHRTLCDGTHGFRIPLDRLFAEATTFELGGVDVPTLSLRHRALHAAYHGALGSAVAPLATRRDLAGHLANPDLPPSALAPEASIWRGEAVLAEAVRAALETFEFDAPQWRQWLENVSIDPVEARIVARQRVESGSFGRAKLTAMAELAWRDRMAFGAAMVWPSPAHLRSRGLTRADVVRRSVGRLRVVAHKRDSG